MSDLSSKNQFPEGTPLHFIQSWQSIREDSSSVEKVFNNSGNCFTLQPTNISHVFNTLHVYVGADLKEQKTLMYVIPGLCDYAKHIEDEYSRYLVSKNAPKGEPGIATRVNSKLESILLQYENVEEKFKGKYTPAQELLIKSIMNWNNAEVRNTWIKDSCAGKTGMVIALDINISDFKIEYDHTCFLALKEVGGSYQMDLVIQNTHTNEFLNLSKNTDGTVSLRDMARPVPPFGQDVFTESQDQFGILGLMS